MVVIRASDSQNRNVDIPILSHTPASYFPLHLSHLCSSSSLLSPLVRKETRVECNDTMSVMQAELLRT